MGGLSMFIAMLILLPTLWIVVLMSGVLSRIPVAYRQVPAESPWVLMTRILPVVWVSEVAVLIGIVGGIASFYVMFKATRSLQEYFRMKGDTSVGNCGMAALIVWMITAIIANIPVVGIVGLPFALISMLVYLFRIRRISRMVQVIA